MAEKIRIVGLIPEGAECTHDPRFSYMTQEEVQAMAACIIAGPADTSWIVRKELDVSYGPVPEQKLDIYLPDEGDGPFPVILYVHGGGWAMGCKTDGAIDCCLEGVKRGYAVVSVDYRLIPDVRFPDNLYDVKTAIRWVRANGAEHHLDPERVGMIGDSAGGHMTLLCATTADRPEYEGPYGWEGQSTRLQACVDLYGISDLLADDEMYLESGKKRMLPHCKPSLYDIMFGSDVDNLLALVSPINMVGKDVPPILFQHGVEDPVVPYQQSTRMYEKVKALCGADHTELDLIPGYTHSDPRFFTEGNKTRILDYFDRYLK